MVWGQLNKDLILAERNSRNSVNSSVGRQKVITDFPATSFASPKTEILDVDTDEIICLANPRSEVRNDSKLNRKRSRESKVECPAQVLPDDSVSWGPSGSDRRGAERPMRRLVSPAADPTFREPRESWRPAPSSLKAESSSSSSIYSNTDFDEGLLTPFFGEVPPPRDVFRGCVFFLNSCDSDPLISAYLLEKLIRRLGGHTSMGVNGLVNYVVAQHLSSAKERKKGGKNAVYVHPHFILACAREGKKVPHKSYLTNVRVDQA